MDAETADKPQQQFFVIETTGDGAECVIVPESDLKQSLHDKMCSCTESWDACATEGIQELCRSLDDDDSWTHHYPDYQRFSWDYDVEDGSVRIVRLTTSGQYEALVDALQSVSDDINQPLTSNGFKLRGSTLDKITAALKATGATS
ncbi:MAG TPA: hypothetical protein VJS44_08150 [Pyrinomonadaceae bacterium]|nr:hypothetical protein [Pyrinomonadaceae bacterium]